MSPRRPRQISLNPKNEQRPKTRNPPPIASVAVLLLAYITGGRTIELTDAGGQRRPNWKLTRPARVRSSDLVGPRHSAFFSTFGSCRSAGKPRNTCRNCSIVNRVPSSKYHRSPLKGEKAM